MKRRALLIRTITGSFSATVFTAVGWLMGTRTLTMTVRPDVQPPCCAQGVQYEPPSIAKICANPGYPCPPSGGQGAWGQCAWDCYVYVCNSDADEWCYTYCFDVAGACCDPGYCPDQ